MSIQRRADELVDLLRPDFVGNDGTASPSFVWVCAGAGTAAAPGFRFCTDLDTGFYLRGANEIGITTQGLARGYWGTGFNVGTGTAAPIGSIYIGGTAPYVRADWSANTGYGGFVLYENGTILGGMEGIGSNFAVAARRNSLEITAFIDDNGFITFGTVTATVQTERARITNAGDVGIGLTPLVRLHVKDNVGDAVAAFWNDGDLNNRWGIVVQCGKDDASGDNQVFIAQDGDGDIEGYLTIDDGVFELNQGSDRRRKKDIVPADSVLDRLRQVEIVKFSWRNKVPGVRHTGYVAQQLHEHFPLIGKHNKETDWWGVAVTRMIPINTKGIQELDSYRLIADAEREAIRAEIGRLQEQLAALDVV